MAVTLLIQRDAKSSYVRSRRLKPFEGGRLVSTTEMIVSRGKTQIFACGTELFSKFKDDVCHPAVD